MTIVAASPDLYAAAEKVGKALDHNELPRPESRALIMSALADVDWVGPPADDLARLALGDASDEQMAAARRDAGSIEGGAAWKVLKELAPKNGPELRRLLKAQSPTRPLPAAGGWSRVARSDRPTTWLVRDFVPAQKITVYLGHEGSLKTGTWLGLLAASMKQEKFLGRDVPSLNWMVVSGEQSADELSEKFDAHGIADDAEFHWTPREAEVALGEPRWNQWLRREVAEVQPDVIVLDSATMTCSGVKVSDNDSVRDLYRDTLRPICDEFSTAILLMHHRNRSGRAGNESAMGASAWTTQADFSVIVAPVAAREDTPNADGIDTYQRFTYLRSKTSRVIASTAPEMIEVRGHVDADGVTDAMGLYGLTVEPSTVDKIIAALEEKPLGRGALAQAVGLNRTGKQFDTALKESLEAGRIVKGDDSLFAVAA